MTEKTALITGGGRRLGAAIVRELHSAGMNIVIHYHDSVDAATALATDLNSKRADSAWLVNGDLADAEFLPRLIDTALACNGRLDALVNNASVFYPTRLPDIDLNLWSDMMDVNLRAPLLLAKHAVRELQKRKGCILNLTDIHAERPLKDYMLYSTSKAGLTMLTKALAKELAPDIRVNAVSPGAVLWPADMDSATQEKIISHIPLKRRGNPEDVAKAVLYLIRDADYVTGEILTVDGGRALYS